LLIVTAVPLERDIVAEGAAVDEPVQLGPYEALRGGSVSGSSITVLAAGVGPAAAAAATATVLSRAEPDAYALVVSAGIGGGLADRVPVGGVVEATSIVAADLGAQSPDGFLSIDELGFGSATVTATPLSIIGAVRGPIFTVSTVTGTAERAAELAARGGFAEAMEGFGVAEAASRHGVPVAELRAISNPVGVRDRAGWDIPGALAALGHAARHLLEVL
jgi:futalosine hydrolase